MINELYDQYERKMLRLLKIVKFIKKHYKKVLYPVVAATVLTVLFLLSVGAFVGELEVGNIVYGEAPAVSAKAFLSEVRYEYTNADGEEWIGGLPTGVGEYRVRAVSINGFGKQKYSDEKIVIVSQAKLSFDFVGENCLYGEEAVSAEQAAVAVGLVNGDRVEDIRCISQRKGTERVVSEVVSFRVVSSDGEDVTDNYEYVPSSVEWAIRKRDLALASRDTELEYCGRTQYCSEVQLVSGSLCEGDRYVVSDLATLEGVGSIESSFDVTVVDKDGKDVTGFYNITRSYGTLVVLPCRITVQIESGSKTYDGTPLTREGFKIVSGSLSDNDRVDIKYLSSLTDAGKSENKASVTIIGESGADMSANYNVTVHPGTLEVLPREITVQTEGGTKIYDGLPLVMEKYDIVSGSLALNHRIEAEFLASQLDVGEAANKVKITIVNANGTDVSANYRVTVNTGTLKVEPRALKVKTGSKTKQCDGKLLVCEELTVTVGSLAEGHTLKSKFTCKNAIEVGTYENTAECTVADASGKVVTKNYSIEYEYGTLEITPIKLVFKTESAKKVYDGKPLVAKGCTLVSGALISGHKVISAVGGGTITDVGEAPNPASVVITDSSGMDVTAKYYSIDSQAGTLVVTPRPAKVQSESAAKVYDGTPLTENRGSWWGQSTDQGILQMHSVHFHCTGSQTEVGESPNTFTVEVVDSTTKQNVTKNYAIEQIVGTLTVKERSEDHEHQDSDDYILGGPMEDSEGGGECSTFSVNNLKQKTRIYLRERSYGDYTLVGWSAPPVYTSATVSPLCYAGTSMTNDNVWFSIRFAEGAPMLVPYYVNQQQWQNLAFDSSDFRTEKTGDYNTYISPNQVVLERNTSQTIRNYALQQEEKKYRTFVYENYLSIPESTKEAMLKVAEENGIKADSKTLIADIQRFISNAAVYKKNIQPFPIGTDKAVYFLTVTKEGYCQHFASAATLMYRAFGIPARYTVGYAVDAYPGDQNVPITSDTAHAWTEVYIDGVGWIFVEVTASATDDGGDSGEDSGEGGGMCDGNCGGGNCGGGHHLTADGEIIVTISTLSVEKVFDRENFANLKTIANPCWVSEGALLKGHRIRAEIVDTAFWLAYPGERTTRLKTFKIYDELGQDVTDMYYPIFDYGTLKIVKREITIVSASASKVYDGTKLEEHSYWIKSGSLLATDKLNVTFTGSQTSTGKSLNRFTYEIVNESGNNQSYYYDVKVVYGDLVVTEE